MPVEPAHLTVPDQPGVRDQQLGVGRQAGDQTSAGHPRQQPFRGCRLCHQETFPSQYVRQYVRCVRCFPGASGQYFRPALAGEPCLGPYGACSNQAPHHGSTGARAAAARCFTRTIRRLGRRWSRAVPGRRAVEQGRRRAGPPRTPRPPRVVPAATAAAAAAASAMPLFMPRAPKGGKRWAASPTSSTAVLGVGEGRRDLAEEVVRRHPQDPVGVPLPHDRGQPSPYRLLGAVGLLRVVVTALQVDLEAPGERHPHDAAAADAGVLVVEDPLQRQVGAGDVGHVHHDVEARPSGCPPWGCPAPAGPPSGRRPRR